VSVADANGCASVDTVNISQPSAIQPSVTAVDVTCHGYTDGSATVVANGGTGALQYNWSPSGGNASTAMALGAGTYTVTVTDANACTTTATINLSEPPAINIIMSSVPLSCYQSNDGLVSAVVNGGSGNYTYFWSPGGAVGSGISNVAAGTYIVHITDSNGCVASDTELVDQPDPIVLSTTASPVSCSGGNSGSVNVFASGGTGAFSYLWIPGNSSTALTTGLAAATYTVTATDVNGCTSTSTATVSSAVPMTLAVNTPPVICVGAPVTLEATATGGATPYHFLWSNADTGSVILVSPGVTSAYSVTVYDANGCTLPPATVTVNVYPPLSVNISPADTICYGDQATVFAAASGGNGGPYSYAWNDSSFTGWTSVVEPVNDSLFVVAAYDGCSPVVHNQVQIIVNPLPQVDFIPHLLNGCTPVEVDFSNMYPQAAGSQYNWNLDDGTVSQDENPSHTYVAPGTYDVSLTITSPEGCIATQTVEDVVTVYGFPDAAFLQSDNSVSIFTPVVTFTDNSTDAISWQWDFGDGSTAVDIENPVHEYADTGTYLVRLIVANQGGCVDTTYGYVYVEQEFTVYIPNAFTPNGDGVNDSFVANGIGWTAYEMWIMDRWGKELFHSTDRTYQWDGSYYSNNSTLCQNDVYEYIIKVTDYKNQSHKFIGHVTLVR
ncbi:MAG: PKD domain-containing protein, partial [Bacteroidia bacterium]